MEDYDIAIASDSYSSEVEEDPCEKHLKIGLPSVNQYFPHQTNTLPKYVKVSYARGKDKLPSFDYRTKIQTLTLKPEILLQTFFEFLSTYTVVLRAREVKIQNGIFATPERK